MGKLAYHALTPPTPTLTVPYLWPGGWTFPDVDTGPWAPGWPTAPKDGTTVTVAIPATVTVGGSATVEARILVEGVDDSDYEAHLLKIVAVKGASTCRMKFEPGDTFADELYIQATNYNTTKYGFSETVYFDTEAADDGLTLLVQCFIVSVIPNVQGIDFTAIGTDTTGLYYSKGSEIRAYDVTGDSSSTVLFDAVVEATIDSTTDAVGMLPLAGTSTAFNLYDAPTNTSTAKASASYSNATQQAGPGTPTGFVWISDEGATVQTQIYVEATNLWSVGTAYPYAVLGVQTANTYCNGQVFVGNNGFERVYTYGLVSGAWVRLADWPTDRRAGIACSDGIYVYVFGGTGTIGEHTAYSYDYNTGAYTALTATPDTIGSSHCGTQYLGNCYISNGSGGTVHHAYNIGTGSYASKNLGITQSGSAAPLVE